MKMFGALVSFLVAIVFSLFLLVVIGHPLKSGSLQHVFDTVDTKAIAVMSTGLAMLFFGAFLLLRALCKTGARLFWQAVEENHLRHQAHMRSINESRHAL